MYRKNWMFFDFTRGFIVFERWNFLNGALHWRFWRSWTKNRENSNVFLFIDDRWFLKWVKRTETEREIVSFRSFTLFSCFRNHFLKQIAAQLTPLQTKPDFMIRLLEFEGVMSDTVFLNHLLTERAWEIFCFTTVIMSWNRFTFTFQISDNFFFQKLRSIKREWLKFSVVSMTIC